MQRPGVRVWSATNLGGWVPLAIVASQDLSWNMFSSCVHFQKNLKVFLLTAVTWGREGGDDDTASVSAETVGEAEC